ncbi:transcription factor grauzone-like [Toxorhynchites rutilus septentrionalis]|uniref:transcription factor grauzone-like n=1 Tax=Toxorhynchites rutilus septentrionalis TaxID=329112 RepID=UPI00247A0E44|nr:transcription factor grauzone-like [Toxorhynchites rutilus septentrionalis]
MSTTELESCFTCLRRTDNFLCIAERDDLSGENVEAVFAKHFWFSRDEYRGRSVCTSCWEKIDEFHKFYCEVELFHNRGVLMNIKVETLDDCAKEYEVLKTESDDSRRNEQIVDNTEIPEGSHQNAPVFVEPICELDLKHESSHNARNMDVERVKTDEESENDPCDTEVDDIDVDEIEDLKPTDRTGIKVPSDDESGSDVPLARRLAARRKRRVATRRKIAGPRCRKEKSDNDELNEFIRQRMDITCHKCAEEGNKPEGGEIFESFYRLREHFRRVHHRPNGYVFCCNKKWSTKTGLAEHLNNHEPLKSDRGRCVECNCIFKDKSSYANHMFLVHTPEDQKQFKCDRCAKAFAAEDLLSSHTKWHEEVEKKNHYCALCNKYFMSARNLENHNLNHHNFGEMSATGQDNVVEQRGAEWMEQTVEIPTNRTSPAKMKRPVDDAAKQDELIRKFITLNCSKCDFVGQTFNKLAYHALKVHKMNSHSVVCCDRRFGKRHRLYEHCLRHLNPDHFKCEICGKTYADSAGLQIHNWWIHTPVSERPFKCDICGAAFVKDYLLKQHTNWHVNKERKTHFCELCNKAFCNSIQLKAHHQKKHGAVCDWVCDICAKGFVHRALLEEHRLTHTEEGLASLKIQCEKCQKWLINKKSYLRHKRRCYDTNGPVKCDICGKESVNEAALMGHKNFHHSNRPMFTCAYCGKEFKTQLRLKEHEATHTGVVLYQCPYCPRTSNSSSNMYTHKKSAHPEKWAEEVASRYYTR